MGGASRGASAVKPRPKKPHGQQPVRLKFTDGWSKETIPLAKMHKDLLREIALMVTSDDAALREKGETKLEKVAEDLATLTIIVEKRKRKTGPAAADARRKIGDDKAKLVLDAIAEGIEPPVGERQLRRIKKRQKK
jgi:hypothetical protein